MRLHYSPTDATTTLILSELEIKHYQY